MQQFNNTRELSVGEVNQIQHKRNVIIISILTLVFLSAFFFSMRDLSPKYTVGIIFLLGFFLISFINIRVGFVLVVMAFLLSPELNLPMSRFRALTIRTEDLLIIVLILAWLGRLAMGLQKHFLLKTPLNMPIFMIILWNILCSWRAIAGGMVDPNFSIFTNLKVMEFFLIYFLVVNNLQSIKEAKFMLYVLLIVALIIGIYVCFQIPTTRIFTVHRLSAPFEGRPEPNTLGGYLAIFFGVAFSIFLFADKSLLKRLCGVLILLLPFPIMFSFSRSAYLAALLMVICLALISRRKWLIVTIIIFLILSPFVLPKPVIQRAMYSFTNARYYGFLDSSAAERVGVFGKALSYIRNYPLFGGGIGAAGGILDSQFARVIIETGLIGLVLFIWLLIGLFKVGIRLFRRAAEGWIKGFSIGFIIVVIGLIAHSFGNVTFYIVRIAEPFWALAAIIAYLLYATEATKINNEKT